MSKSQSNGAVCQMCGDKLTNSTRPIENDYVCLKCWKDNQSECVRWERRHHKARLQEYPSPPHCWFCRKSPPNQATAQDTYVFKQQTQRYGRGDSVILETSGFAVPRCRSCRIQHLKRHLYSAVTCIPLVLLAYGCEVFLEWPHVANAGKLTLLGGMFYIPLGYTCFFFFLYRSHIVSGTQIAKHHPAGQAFFED